MYKVKVNYFYCFGGREVRGEGKVVWESVEFWDRKILICKGVLVFKKFFYG